MILAPLLWWAVGGATVGYRGVLVLLAAFSFVGGAGMGSFIGRQVRLRSGRDWAVNLAAGMAGLSLAVAFTINAFNGAAYFLVGSGTVLGRYGRDPGSRHWREATILVLAGIFLAGWLM